MPKTEIRKLLTEIKKQVDNPSSNTEQQIKELASETPIHADEATAIYQMMCEFYKEVEKRGGIEKYIHSSISWLKIELELLNACYQIAISHDMKVMDISEMLSLNDLKIFPKTPSQLQNTYYKLKKDIIQFEDIQKNKPGRKRKSEKDKKQKTNIFGQAVPVSPAVPSSLKEKIHFDKNKEKNLVDLLSGMKSNVQILSETTGNHNVYDLLKSIYSLSSLAVQKEELDRKYQVLQNENADLEQQIFTLKQQNEALTEEFHTLAKQVAQFVYTDDVEQISALPLFAQESIVTLNKLGVFKENYKDM
ncbi:DNA-binding domain-containing protein [Listeria ilorinensis]|uniref:DNA-binding domain-containing protein n=1 Tax=Listeria ilorinensis TaxID=2867439 RepID=UPI001EF53DC5|nr:DNA-binding domain-containing protein [Listeria ilorinensis]